MMWGEGATDTSTGDIANWSLHWGVARLPTPTCVATSDCPGGIQVFRAGTLPPIHRWGRGQERG